MTTSARTRKYGPGWWARLYARFGLSFTPTIGMSSKAYYAGTVGLVLNPALTMTGVGKNTAAFTFGLTPSLTMGGVNRNVGALALSFTPALTVSAIERYARDFEVHLSPVIGMTSGFTPPSYPFAVALTPSVSMSGTERYSAAMTVGLTPAIVMDGAPRDTAAVGISLTPSVSMSGAERYSAAMTVGLTPAVAMGANLVQPFGISLTPSVSMAGAERYAAAMTVGLTPSIGMGGTPRDTAAVSVSLSPSIGMAGVERYSAAMTVGLTPAIGMTANLVQPLVTRDSATGYLMVGGSRFRFAGNNGDFWGLSEDTTTYGETVTSGLHMTSHAATDDYFTAAVSMNTSVIRTFTSGLGASGTFMPTLGTYDHTALEGLDYAITKCRANGMRLIAALVDDYDYYYHGKFTWCTLSGVTPDGTASQFFTNATVIANFKAYVSALLNHTNVYTGIKYKDDPVFLAWETGNELDGSATPQNLLDWTADIAQYLKVTVGAQQLVMDGKWGITSNSVVPAAHMSNQYIDMFTEHTYDQWRTPAHMANQAAICHNYGKAFIVGEYPLTGLNQSGASIGWGNPDMIAAVEGNKNVDGDMWWNLLPQGNTHGGGYATHAPGDDANMIARVTAQGNHATAMAGSTLRNATDHPKTKTLVGPDINAGLWTARSTANITGGQIVLPTSDTAYSSVSVCDLSNSEMVVQLIQKNPSTGAAMCGMCAAVSPAPYGPDNVGIFVAGNTVYYRSHIGGADSDVSEPYSTSDHRWLRVRTTADATNLTAYPYAVGTIFFDTSSDGLNWINKRTLTTTLVTTSLYPILLNWNYGSVGDSGTAIFDNFNSAPLPGPPVGKIIKPHMVRSKHGRIR